MHLVSKYSASHVSVRRTIGLIIARADRYRSEQNADLQGRDRRAPWPHPDIKRWEDEKGARGQPERSLRLRDNRPIRAFPPRRFSVRLGIFPRRTASNSRQGYSLHRRVRCNRYNRHCFAIRADLLLHPETPRRRAPTPSAPDITAISTRATRVISS